MEQYNALSRAQLSFDYLHTNSTTHEFLFGAIAELIDNSRDAGATELDIYTIKDDSLRGGYMLCFADNGCGMTTDETRNVIIFGRSIKKGAESTSIGMYGNGLKSGSMRIGNDMILFTKKDGVMTCLFLSRTFHEEEKIDEVVVPLPAFRGSEKAPIFDGAEDKKRHDLEMSLILRYSPFRCQKDLFAQFDKIKGSNGSLVIIYNMKLLDNGEPELDVGKDTRDIILTHPDIGDNPSIDLDVEMSHERRSLRSYISILYADPRMKVYLQGRKVQTKRLVSSLYKPRMYNFASKTFRTRAEAEVSRAKEEVKIAELRAKESESKARDLENRFHDSTDPEHLKTIRKARNWACTLRENVKQKQNAALRKTKSLKDPKTLTFYFGLNLENRSTDGMFVYNCSRLIKMYQRIGPQQDSGMTCRGVVGFVNVPYLVLEPTHNKQDFADAKEFRALMRSMADHLMQYWDDLEIDRRGVDQFWTGFGYLSAKWRDAPSIEDKYVKKRALSTCVCVQCDQCLKWRILPFQQSQVGKEVPDNWQCKDNPDPKHKRCSEPEQQLNIPVGVIKRKIKTKEQRQSELEEQIRKKQEELEKMKVDGSSAKKRHAQQSSSEESSSEEDVPRKQSNQKPNTTPPASRGRPVVSPGNKQSSLTNKFNVTPPVTKKGRISSPPTTTRPLSSLATKKTGKPTPMGRRRVQDQESSEESEESEEERPPVKTARSLGRANTATSPVIKRVTQEPPAPARRRSPSPKPSRQPESSSATVKPNPVKTPTLQLPAANKTPVSVPSTTANEKQGSNSSGQSAAVNRTLDNGVTSNNTNVVGVSKSASATSSDHTAVTSVIAPNQPIIKMEPAVDTLDEPEARTPSKVLNRKLEVRVAKQWLIGQGVEVKDNRVRVKFDNMPEDIHDRWISINSNDLKLRPVVIDVNTDGPSSDTDKIVENFKVCLRYFLPPDWPVDKEKIHNLSVRDLSEFPLDKFFDRYEQGLRKLLSNFQSESTASREKLTDLRTNVAKLMSKVKKDPSIASSDPDNMDKLLQNYLDSL